MVRKATADDAADNTADNTATASGKRSKGQRSNGGGIAPYALVAIAGCTLALLLGAWQIQVRVLQPRAAEGQERLATAYARQYAAFFNQVIDQATRHMAGFADSADLATALASGDRARIDQAAATFAASLGGHASVFIVPAAGPFDIPLGFIAQDMVEKARRGEPVRPEVVPQKENPLLLLARPLKDGAGQTAGVLLAGLELKEVRNNLKMFDASIGHMRLTQQFDDGEPQAVLEYGDSSPAPVVSEPTRQKHLVVEFAPKPAATGKTDPLFWGIVGATLLLVLASIAASQFLLLRALRRNASMLLQYAESLLQRERIPAGLQFSLDLFGDVAASLSRTGKSPAAAPAITGRDDTASPAENARPTARKDKPTASAAAPAPVTVAGEIFRAYDIRGVVGQTLTEDTVRLLGKAIGSEAQDNNQQTLYVARDGRLSGPQLVEAFIQGVVSTGCKVINLGMVPTPVLYFATTNSAIKSGVVITGSHNPPDHNGLKIVINGETLAEQRIQALKERILAGNFRSGKGSTETADFTAKYIERIRDDIVLARNMKIVVDCGNGVPGAIAPQVLSTIGCHVVPLYCDVDGNFPNHHPDPTNPKNLADLIAAVASEGADLGIAFDGDGDRIGIVTPRGTIIFADRLMMLYARDLLTRSPGADIIFDVKCTRDLATVISQNGGRPVMSRTGHSLIKAKLKETGAALAGEMSGHIFFNDRWPGFDDGLYAAARLLEILSLEAGTADDVFSEFPSNISTPEIHIEVAEDRKFAIVEALQVKGEFPGGNIITIDGVRVDFPDSWGLVRASNTTPMLVARFEARTEQELERVKAMFRAQLAKADPSLQIPF